MDGKNGKFVKEFVRAERKQYPSQREKEKGLERVFL